ncbi:MAG TPA: hypothetical protein VMV57_04430 [Terracidiphilus sp.]|nr:hypothetical protein [Terracidiphilus sp.]
MKTLSSTILLLACLATPAFATVVVSSPQNGQTVSSNVYYAATATTSTCSKGVASMGVYVDYKLLDVVNGTTLKTTLPVSPGTHNTVVEEWDYCGGATFVSMTITVNSQSGVFVTSPANNSTVSSLANYVATATTSCSKGVASMGVYVNNKLVVVQNGAKLNTQVNLAAGPQKTVVEEWDYCGGASYTPINVTVQQVGTTLSNLQRSTGWNSWGQGPPNYVDCSPSPCNGYQYSHKLNVASPSLSGNATQFSLGGPYGTAPWGDVLFSLPLIGQFSTQGLPDTGHTLLPTIHNFTYNADFYVTNASVTQVLEFDVSMYMNGVGMIWGTQCNNLGGKVWDIWDNANAHWVSTGVPCNLINKGWNHVTLQLQRKSDNSLLYQTITLNGITANINKTYPPFTVPSSWWGVTVNYQLDGNATQSAYTTYLDNFSLNYW